jgi:hypothetical protein
MKAVLITLAIGTVGSGCWWILYRHGSGMFNSTFVTAAVLLPALALLLKKKPD